MDRRALIASCIVATVAFIAYTRTLLPGVDLGDTGAFQAAVLWPEISARQAYPLYYMLAKPFVAGLSPTNPARGLNLFSAVCASAASGILTGVVARVMGSVGGGVAAGLLLAFSYTFWTQAVIAEVYALHLAVVGVCLLALTWWQRHPSTPRLALFFAVYAIGFGNHLSMILLLVPFAVFILLAARRPADVLQLRVVMLAIGVAALGSLQYLPNFWAVWGAMDAPERWTDRLAAFWFDVTKSDWRETMVLGVGSSQLSERFAMFGFDARQQFGIAGLLLGTAGVAGLWRANRPWAVLAVSAYAINTGFAITYNVGDPHVFFLPSHYFVALSAGAAIAAAAQSLAVWPAAASLVLAGGVSYAIWRGYDTWPGVDRHEDRRAEQLVNRLTTGLDDRTELLTVRLNWQVENALLYETRYRLRHITWVRVGDVLPYFPLLARDNLATGRDVVLTAAAVPQVLTAFGPLFPLVQDPFPPAPSLVAFASRIPPGTPYVLTILAPSRDEALDPGELGEALALLTGGRVQRSRGSNYEVLVGRRGDLPLLHRTDAQPFRQAVKLPEGNLDVRMEGWLPLETFRRGGFGRVLLNRRPLLTVERGVSIRALNVSEAFYTAGVYATQPRFRIPAGGLPQVALLH